MARAINLFCLAGVVVALVPTTVTWVTADDSLPIGVGKHVSAIDIMTERVSSDCPCLVASATLFTTATVLLLASPLGSFLQFAGIGVLLLATPSRIYCGGAYCIWYADVGIGIAVAGVAAALPLIGLMMPVGVTSRLRLVRLRGRYITFGLAIEGDHRNQSP
jgi:hypothetical protein